MHDIGRFFKGLEAIRAAATMLLREFMMDELWCGELDRDKKVYHVANDVIG